MTILIPALYLLFFIFLIGKLKFFSFEGLSKLHLFALFLLKCFAGAGVWLVYTYYYPGSDFHLYFNGSKKMLDQLLAGDPVYPVPGWNSNFDGGIFNNSRVMISLNMLLHLISFNNIFVHILFFCFFSFTGLTALYKAFRNHFQQKNYALVLGIYLVPSVLFWTGGIYKETLAVFCLGLLIYITDFGLRRTYSTTQIVFTALLLMSLFFVKFYVLAAVFPVLLVNFIAGRTTKEKLWIKYALVFTSLVLLLHLLSMISDPTSVYKLIADKQAKAVSEAEGGIFLVNDKNFIRLDYDDTEVLLMQPDSSYKIKKDSKYLSWQLNNMRDTTFVSASADTASFKLLYTVVPVKMALHPVKLQPTFISVYKNLPLAVFNVLVQPLIFSINNFFQLFSAVENIWIVLLILLSLFFFDISVVPQKAVLLFCLFLVLMQFAAIGLTTPAVGAMVRYKSIALPFLVTASLLCIDLSRLGKMMSRFKNQDSGTK